MCCTGFASKFTPQSPEWQTGHKVCPLKQTFKIHVTFGADLHQAMKCIGADRHFSSISKSKHNLTFYAHLEVNLLKSANSIKVLIWLSDGHQQVWNGDSTEGGKVGYVL